MQKTPQALTSGQAAHYCFVTSDTILNWIKANCLPGQRTVGGQYRIRVDDLRHFMNRHGMSTELLDQELETRCYCWEFHHAANKRQSKCALGGCDDCLVKKSMASECYILRAASPNGHWLLADCAQCEYFSKWSSSDFEDIKADLQKESAAAVPVK